MRWIGPAWMVVLLVVGCGGEAPPLDELSLRDTLRAEPEVVASLGDEVRQRLATRFEMARIAGGASDEIADAPTPAAEVTALDEARTRRSADALVVGASAGGVAWPVAATVGASESAALPPLEGEVATNTAALEARALEGPAGAALRGLVATSGARRLERVVEWPVGAIAIGDTVYVDASWLVALAPVETSADGGVGIAPAPAAGTATSDSAGALSAASPLGVAAASSSGAPGASSARFDGGCPPDDINCSIFDAGTVTPPATATPPSPPNPPPPPTTTTTAPSFWDACSAGCAAGDSCDTSDDDSDSCSGGGDGYDDSSSCSGGGDDGSGDACSSPPDDGADCRTAPGRGHPRDAMIVWMLAPLGFLLGKRR
jgi:hypothetical protein